MICDKIDKRSKCSFRSKNNICKAIGLCERVIEKCSSCKHNIESFCDVFIVPRVHWIALGGCPMDTNRVIKEEEVKHKLNPIKASKKKGKKK